MRTDGLIAEIEKRFGLAAIELYIAAARGGPVDPTTLLARDLAAFLQEQGARSPEKETVLDVLLTTPEGRS